MLDAVTSGLTVVIAVQRYGGVASWRELQDHVTQHAVRRAVAAGEVRRLRRGRYGLPDLPGARQVATQVAGTVSHVSAAENHRIPLLLPPTASHVTVRPNAHPTVPRLTQLHWLPLSRDDVEAGVTSVLRTVLDCSASLPFAEAVAIADGAVRLGLVSKERLVATAVQRRGKGPAAGRHVATAADPRAANPFESALRALALEAGCTGFEPQVTVELVGAPPARVDLADVARRVVLEADSFEWHGGRMALRRDSRRYDELVRAGWAVLRFAWEDVMFDPAWVRAVIRDVVAARTPRREENARTASRSAAA